MYIYRMFEIPTYKECLEIVENSTSPIFYESKHEVDGYNISIFNYRLFGNFTKKSSELRGITFVFNKDGSLYKRYLMLHKFFNVNQTEETLLSKISKFNIKSVMNKEDGSLASFVKLPNGKIVGRSKASFISEQAIRITNIYENNSDIRKLVNYSFDNDISLFFEYVSPTNKIVLNYNKEELILIRARDIDGNYIDIREIDTNVKVANFYENYTLETISKNVETKENLEGYVIEFDNGFMVKWKTSWYFTKHSLFTDLLNKESIIIKLIVNEEIDDVICQLDKNNETDISKLEMIDELTDKINTYIVNKCKSTEKLLEKYDNDVREFAISNSKKENFRYAISVINGIDLIDSIKFDILKKTSRLERARLFIKNIETND